MLEQQVGTLFDQQAAVEAATETLQSQTTVINNFAQNALQRLTAIGA